MRKSMIAGPMIVFAAFCLMIARDAAAQDAQEEGPVGRATFHAEEGGTEVDGDPGISVELRDSEFRVSGTTTDSAWRPDGIELPFDDQGGEAVVSGKFRLPRRGGSGLVYLCVVAENANKLIVAFSWGPS